MSFGSHLGGLGGAHFEEYSRVWVGGWGWCRVGGSGVVCWRDRVGVGKGSVVACCAREGVLELELA